MANAPCRVRICLVLAGLLISSACNKSEPASTPAAAIAPTDHVSPSPVGTNQSVLEKTFNLKGSAIFPFEIPAHAAQPHLHGIFASYVGQVHGASDETANIGFMILNAEQNEAMTSNRPSEALFTVESSHNQAVNFDLPSSRDQPVKYYLVFRNAEGSASQKVVQAQFRIDF